MLRPLPEGGTRSLSSTLPQHQGCVQIGIFPHTGPLGPASARQIGLMVKSPTVLYQKAAQQAILVCCGPCTPCMDARR